MTSAEEEQFPDAPAWFQQALATPGKARHLDFNGVSLHLMSWGNPQAKAGVLMIHGGLAHVHWWQFIAPFLKQDFYLVAFDLSGHGRSGHRTQYKMSHWIDETAFVAEHAGFAGKPFLVGHSMGGLVASAVAGRFPDRWAGLVVNDAPIHQVAEIKDEGKAGKSYSHIKPYADLETAISRFRLLPHQPCEHTFLIRYLARQSLKQVEQGWLWRFDPSVFERFVRIPLGPLLAEIRCPMVLLRGEHSVLVGPEVSEMVPQLVKVPCPVIEIPAAHHHVMLDQPLAFISVLRSLLASWSAHLG